MSVITPQEDAPDRADSAEPSQRGSSEPDSGDPGANFGPGTTRAQLQAAKDQVVEQARTSFREVREVAGSSLSNSRRRAADQVGKVASALRRTSEHLREETPGPIADFAQSLSRHVEQASSYIRESDAGKMGDDVEQLVRRRPGLVIGGTFALGLLMARFMKSSEKRGTVGHA